MAFPDLTFRDSLPPNVRQELEQYAALQQGYLATEHDSEGAHTNINALSVTVDGDVTAAGDGTFDGDVSAVSGTVRLTTAVESGVSDGSGGPALVLGTDGDDDRVALYAESAGANDYVKLSHGTITPLMIRRTATDIYVQPGPVTNQSYVTSLGGDLSADAIWDKARIAEIFHTHNGTIALGKWTTYSPTLANITIGNGTTAGRWTRVMGKTIMATVRIVLGNTSTVDGHIGISLPTAHDAIATSKARAEFYDQNTNTMYAGAVRTTTTPGLLLYYHDCSGTAVVLTAANATAPFTFTTSDEITLVALYEEP